MKFLLDTHLLLWAAGEPDRLPKSAHKLLDDLENEFYFSAASLWEISIMNSLGRKDFHVEPRLLRRGLLDNGYTELLLSSEHAVTIDILPPIHKDPFDRMLIAQSLIEGIILLTADSIVASYGATIRLCR